MNSELKKNLESLAYQRTMPFCYSCYSKAPTGRCAKCGNDDLMVCLEGVGVEYGIDWVLRHIVEEECAPVDTDEAFESMIRECYPETIDIGWIKNYDLVSALKELDSVAWELAKSEWIDAEESDERIVSLDGGVTYFWVSDLEKL